MANVEQFQNEAPLVTQRTGILATSSNALARIREAIDQPGFRRAFPTTFPRPSMIFGSMISICFFSRL